MLTPIAVSALTSLSLGVGIVHADDSNWSGPHAVKADAACQQADAVCTAHLTVVHDGSEVISARVT